MPPSPEHSRADLDRILTTNAAAAMQCLAAAEQAVGQGRFNLAKVLRACAHAARLASLNAARELAEHRDPEEALTGFAALVDDDSIRRGTATSREVALQGVIERAVSSLQRNRDVLETDVAQFLWGCQVCGAVAEGARPGGCVWCGALGFEFERFGPFFTSTFERLGRRDASAIARIVEESPRRLAAMFSGVDESSLARRPSADEWSAKEIGGHLIDVTELFCQRVRVILGAASPPALHDALPPWRLLEGKNYPETPAAVIVERFQSVTAVALDLIRDFDAAQWGRSAVVAGYLATILDIGTWLANHNVAHLAQIDAWRAQGFRSAS